MLKFKIEKALKENGEFSGRWAVVGRDAAGKVDDCRLYDTLKRAKSALAARREEQAEGVPSDAAIRASMSWW